jgi:FAD/FMN-containing dehydrogenase
VKYLIGKDFSNQSSNQTDFGHIYYDIPHEIFYPESVEELALLLKELNSQDKLVTIRNAGHSVNGQTLTDKVQVNVSKINKVSFDEENLEVRTGPGASWDEVFQCIGLPKYSLPIFPNNPGQQIHIGGTACVGGCGLYITTRGGMWNHIKSIKLVTMTGEIIECDRQKNSELLQYSLGGLGRLGVIAEMVLNVEPSTENVDVPVILTSNIDKMLEIVDKGYQLKYFDAIFAIKLLNMPKVIPTYGIMFIKEYKTEAERQYAEKLVKDNFHPLVPMHLTEEKIGKHIHDLDLSFKKVSVSKQELVYAYPTPAHEDQLSGLHPWSDYIVSIDSFKDFMNKASELLEKYDMSKYILKEGLLSSVFDIPLLTIYTCKKDSADFDYPLVPNYGIPGEYCFAISFLPTVPLEKLDDAVKMTNELTDFCYSIGGKRYMYGLHNLSREDVEKQYAPKDIERWNELKKVYDPKNLLNIGVIENLDIV